MSKGSQYTRSVWRVPPQPRDMLSAKTEKKEGEASDHAHVSLATSFERTTEPNTRTHAPCSIACCPPVHSPCTNLLATRQALAAVPPPTHPAAAYPALPATPSEIDRARLALGPLPGVLHVRTAYS